MSNTHNIASLISKNCTQFLEKKAIVSLIKNNTKEIYFRQLEETSNQYANGFYKQGIRQGMRVLMLVPHSIDFYLCIFSLFKLGAIPVIIDPGMKIKQLLDCILQAEAQAMIGISKAFFLKSIFASYFKSCKINISVGKNYIFKSPSLHDFKKNKEKERFTVVDTKPNDTAAILFTSGSTGVAKGVVYEHNMFYQQTIMIKNMLGLEPTQSDLPCFPLFGLFSLALGLTLYLPDIDTSYPASANPKKIIDALNKYDITNCFASPAIWSKIIGYCKEYNQKIPALQRYIMAGAPIEYSMLKELKLHVSNDTSEIWIPYGATESLPITITTAKDRLAFDEIRENHLPSINVGKAVSGVEIKIIKSTDDAIQDIKNSQILSTYEVGEIIARSACTTRQYYKRDDKTRLSKIYDGNSFWHRMGDVGFLDKEGNLWYCGRKDHIVHLSNKEKLYSICCELLANQHHCVRRSALVGVSDKSHSTIAVIVIELHDHVKRESFLAHEILKLVQKGLKNNNINKLLFYKKLPMDTRHNAKINREALSKWAEQQKSFYELAS